MTNTSSMMSIPARSLAAFVAVVGLPALAVAQQQPVTVTGQVVSTGGAPVVAASVFIASMQLGATTNQEGRYTFTVPAARATGQTVTLTARAVGYAPANAQITLGGGEIVQNFTLSSSPLRLSEVVVTGAGTATEAEKLGVARANVDSTAIRRANEPNLVNALAAKAPGVNVLSSSGEAGASSYVRVRGLTSIAASDGQPLIVVDGMPIDNSTTDTPFSGGNGGTVASNRAIDINPADIANIEILKGASASAIYGSRAGQGVILITTRRGRPGETRYSLRSNVSVDRVSNLPDLQTEYGVGTGGTTPACYVTPTPNCAIGFGAAGSWGPRLASGAPRYDHTDEIFEQGLTVDNTLSVSGGSERTQFYLSAGMLNQQGIVIGNQDAFDRYTVRFNGAHQAFSNLTVGVNATYATTSGSFVQSRNNTSGLLLGAWRSPVDFNNFPYLDPQTGLHRSYRFPFPAAGSEFVTRRYDNPLFVAYESEATSDVGRALGNVTLDYYPWQWLRVNYSLGTDFSQDERLEALPWSNSGGAASVVGTGYVVRASIRNTQIDHNLAATATYSVSPNIRGTVTLGQNLNAQSQRQSAAIGIGLIAPQPFNLTNTNTQNPPADVRTELRVESYFGQVTADLYDQLYLTAALRNDGVSSFGATNRRAFFPKASAAWTFLGEGSSDNPYLSFGKLRTAYGQSGTQPAPYQTQTVFTSAQILEGGWGPVLAAQQNGVTGLYTAPTLGNPDLGPERVHEFEVGADLGLLRNRADLSLTHYRQRTTDAILVFPVPATTGYLQQLRNVGSLENIGYEVALNVRPVQTPDFEWEVGLQWAQNRNKVLSMSGANQVVLNAPFGLGSFPQAVVREGEAIGVWLSDDFVRCGRGLTVGGVDIDNTSGHCQGAPAGALYIGADGYPLKDNEGQYILADPNPDWTGGLRSTFSFRKFTVGGLLDIRQGGDVWNGTRTALNHFGRTRESATFREGTFVFGSSYLPNETAAGPGAGDAVALGEGWFSGLGGVFNGPASFAFEDGSFIKLRELSVGYSWDTPTVRRLGFGSIDLRVAGRNLYTWTDYTGVDPETSVLNAQQSVVRGVDYFNNPQTRSFVFTLTLNR